MSVENINEFSELVRTRVELELQFSLLPTDILLLIFDYCGIYELYSLSRCCKRLHSIISDDAVWRNRSRHLIIANQLSPKVISRSCKELSAKEKCRIALNWKLGRYREENLTRKKSVKYMPRIILEKHRLWLTVLDEIHAYDREGSFVNWKQPKLRLAKGHSGDVHCIVKTANEILLSGGRDGRICGWSEQSGDLLFELQKGDANDSSYVRCMDASGGLVVSCLSRVYNFGRPESVLLKVWRLFEEEIQSFTLNPPASVLNIMDSVWCTAIDPSRTVVCCGTKGLNYQSPESVKLIDLESGNMKGLSSSKMGAGIFGIKWETPNTFLTCGYDSTLRRWDKRQLTCVNTWTDPFDSALYCLATDDMHSVICGNGNNARVQLWDLRMSISVQAYFCATKESSPVYSVAFDPCCLFATLANSLNVLNFSVRMGKVKNFRSCWTSHVHNNLP